MTFRNPFRLDGFDRAQPPGVYSVETDEELLDTMTCRALRRTQTRIEIRGHNGGPAFIQQIPIDPADLDRALARDAADEPPPPSGGPAC